MNSSLPQMNLICYHPAFDPPSSAYFWCYGASLLPLPIGIAIAWASAWLCPGSKCSNKHIRKQRRIKRQLAEQQQMVKRSIEPAGLEQATVVIEARPAGDPVVKKKHGGLFPMSDVIEGQTPEEIYFDSLRNY